MIIDYRFRAAKLADRIKLGYLLAIIVNINTPLKSGKIYR